MSTGQYGSQSFDSLKKGLLKLLQDMLNSFVTEYLPGAVGASPNTTRSYKAAFRLLLKYMYQEKGIPADQISFEALDYQTMIDFLSWLGSLMMRISLEGHMLEAGVPLVVIKNFLGHSSLQSTQIYAEISQHTMDKHLKEWNERWFSIPSNADHGAIRDNEIPNFLR